MNELVQTPFGGSEKNNYLDESFRDVVRNIGYDKILSESQKDLIYFVLKNEDLFHTDYNMNIIHRNISTIFSDPDFYDIVMSRMVIEKKKLELKIREAQVVKNKIQDAFNRLKQERNLFFP